METRVLTLPRQVTFRFLGPDEVEVAYGIDRVMAIPRAEVATLEAFVVPRTVGEAHAAAGGGEGREAFEARVARYVDLGVIAGEEKTDEVDLSALLRPDLLAEGEQRAAIARELSAGHVCVIQDAFRSEFAERVHRALDAFDEWEGFRVFRRPYASAAGQSITHRESYPPELLECERAFAAPGSKRLIADLSGARCDGELLLDARLYLPGDFLSPHPDTYTKRSVTFLWQLTREWDRRWGGHFFWCSPPANIVPTFNTLILFKVTGRDYHAVTTVSPYARGRRLAINGWWTATEGEPVLQDPPGAWYRGAVRPIGPGLFAIG